MTIKMTIIYFLELLFSLIWNQGRTNSSVDEENTKWTLIISELLIQLAHFDESNYAYCQLMFERCT